MQGDQVAELRVFCDSELVQSAPLFAAETVEQGDIVRRVSDALKQLALGWLGRICTNSTRTKHPKPILPASSPLRVVKASAKSTQVKRLQHRLQERGIEVVRTREPGGTAKAEAIRSFRACRGARKTGGAGGEAVLFAAARLDHVNQLIAPNCAAACGCCPTCSTIDPRLSGTDRRRGRQIDRRAGNAGA